MRAIFIQQDHASPVGPIGERFADQGYEICEFNVVPADRHHQPDVSVRFPDPLDYDVVIPMGAPWSVYDRLTIGTWIGDELDVLRRAHAAGVPILGICFGGQALAAALGGTVVRAERGELGWVTLRTDRPGLIDAGPWFEWHTDRWILPEGAEAVARPDAAEQAFVCGRSLGLQFHPEVTPDALRRWLRSDGDDPALAGVTDYEPLLAETDRIAGANRDRAHRLVDRFLGQVARAVPVPVPALR
ncbi:MAG: type 1 glutamine amidotransferase [Streptosporangiaceae bacterium]